MLNKKSKPINRVTDITSKIMELPQHYLLSELMPFKNKFYRITKTWYGKDIVTLVVNTDSIYKAEIFSKGSKFKSLLQNAGIEYEEDKGTTKVEEVEVKDLTAEELLKAIVICMSGVEQRKLLNEYSVEKEMALLNDFVKSIKS